MNTSDLSSFLVRKPAQLNASWAQRIVERHAPGTEVDKVYKESVHIGTTSRIRLRVSHNGPETLPRRWFVKLPSRSWRAWMITALPRLLQMEIRFYNEVAPQVPIEHPKVLAAVKKFGRGTTLVLEDIRERGGRPGSPGDSLSFEEIRSLVIELARLHSHFWEKPCLEEEYTWLAGPVRRLEDFLGTALAVHLMKKGLKGAGEAIDKDLHKGALHYARNRRQAMKILSSGPQTLIHHDCHPGNLYWIDGKPGFLDWQLVRTGEGMSDIAYLLALGMEPADRRRREEELVEIYRQNLARQGVEVEDLEDLMASYTRHLTYPFEALVVTLAIGSMMEEEANLTLIRRAAAAVSDRDSFGALEALFC